jgi:hypothetical protein
VEKAVTFSGMTDLLTDSSHYSIQTVSIRLGRVTDKTSVLGVSEVIFRASRKTSLHSRRVEAIRSRWSQIVKKNNQKSKEENMNDRKNNRPRGRPRVSGVCKLSKAVTVKFSKIDYERLCRRSRQANLTLAEFLRVSAFETTITARHSAEETAVIRSLTGMANNLNQLTRLSHQAGFHRTQKTVTELLLKLKEIIVRYRNVERRQS